MSAPASKKNAKEGSRKFWARTVPDIINYLTLVLSLGLIVFISWDTYLGTDYLMNPVYMKYQFIVCLVFLAEYIYRLIISEHKIKFFILAFPFLLVSIPYLNIVEFFGLDVNRTLLFYLCSVPIFRGLFALVMVVTYVTKNITTTVFASYVLVLVPVVYMSGLVFYIAEKGLNPPVKNLWYALWWAGMNVTTIGCNINPVTPTGMVLGLLLSLLGIIMFPLFTVYFGDVIRGFSRTSLLHNK